MARRKIPNRRDSSRHGCMPIRHLEQGTSQCRLVQRLAGTDQRAAVVASQRDESVLGSWKLEQVWRCGEDFVGDLHGGAVLWVVVSAFRADGGHLDADAGELVEYGGEVGLWGCDGHTVCVHVDGKVCLLRRGMFSDRTGQGSRITPMSDLLVACYDSHDFASIRRRRPSCRH